MLCPLAALTGSTDTAAPPSNGSVASVATFANDGGGTTPGSDAINLSTSGYKSKGTAYVDLSWHGAATSTVDIYRNGSKLGSMANTNSYTDTITTKGGGSYTYQVCEAQSTTICSNNSTANF